MRKLVLIAALAAPVALAVPAQAQKMNLMPDTSRHLTPEQIAREKAIEQQYNETNANLPDKKGSSDPWGNVRAASPAPSAAKPRKP